MTDANDLYGIALDRFVAEREALAKALRAEGHRERAAAIVRLRKPSMAAWAVNQLVRTQRRAVGALFDAGDALVRAQAELLDGGGNPRVLRETSERERAAVGELAEAARGLLSADGHELTQVTLDRVSETLHAAALDREARLQVRDACLERELRHVGLGSIGGTIASTDSARRPGPGPRKAAERKPGRGSHRAAGRKPSQGSHGTAEAKPVQGSHRVAEAKADTAGPTKPAAAVKRDAERRAQADRAEQRERAEKLKSARQAEADARRKAERAARELKKAEKTLNDAASSLRDAEAAVAVARERAKQADLAHRRAQKALRGSETDDRL